MTTKESNQSKPVVKKMAKTVAGRKTTAALEPLALPKSDLAAAMAQAEAQAWANSHPKPVVPRLGIEAEELGISADVVDRMVAMPLSKEDSNTAPLPVGYPYRIRMQRKEYELEKQKLQIELLKAQNWIKDSGQRIVLLFEGRDAAGKGGATGEAPRPAAA